MSQELTAPDKLGTDSIAIALVEAGVPSARIEALAIEYADLVAIQTIPDGDDELYERVHKADMACRDVESTIEAVMKELRDDALKWQRFVLKVAPYTDAAGRTAALVEAEHLLDATTHPALVAGV